MLSSVSQIPPPPPPPHSRDLIELVPLIIKESFGEEVSNVSSVMVTAAAMSLSEIQRRCGLSYSATKNAVTIMVIHSIVVVSELKGYAAIEASAAPVKPSQLFSLHVDMVLMRLRFARVVDYCRGEYDDASVFLLSELLQHGWLAGPRLCQQALQAAQRALEESLEGDQGKDQHPIVKNPSQLTLQMFEESFKTMASRRFITLVSSTTSSSPTMTDNVAGKEFPAIESDVVGRKREMRPLPDALTRKRQRTGIDTEVEVSNDGDIHRPSRPNADLIDISSIATDANVVWCVSFLPFLSATRRAAVVEVVTHRQDAHSALVVKVMLDLSAPFEDGLPDRSVGVSKSDILCKLESMNAGMTMVRVTEILHCLSNDRIGLVCRLNDSDDRYQVRLSDILEHSRRRILEAVVTEQCGAKATRIVRLLLQKRQLEQKQIADAVMLPIKTTRALLTQLLKARLVAVQEVPRSADYAFARTFYLWNVPYQTVSHRISEKLYRTLLNLFLRLQSERKKLDNVNDDISAIVAPAIAASNHTAEEGGVAAADAVVSELTGLEPLRTTLTHRVSTLQLALLSLDDHLLLVRDWARPQPNDPASPDVE